jgi:phage terminase small subunit
MATKKVAPAKTKPRARPAKTTTTAGVASDATPHGLNPRQRAFVVEYLADKNATQAAIRAGYSAATARQIGSRLLTDVVIRAEVDRLENEALAKVQAETGITLERTLRTIAAVAYHDPRKFYGEDGELKPIRDLDDDTALALAGFEVQEDFAGSGAERVQIGRTKKVKISERKGYLDMLMKHLGGYKADNEQGGEAAAKALQGLVVRFVEPGAS